MRNFNAFLVMLFLWTSNAESIKIGTVIAEGNINMRSTPEIMDDNIVGFLPNGATVIIFDQTAEPDTINGKVDYWFNITRPYERSSWVFGYSLDLIHLEEFSNYEDVLQTAIKCYPESLILSSEYFPFSVDRIKNGEAEGVIGLINLANIDQDISYELFVEYNTSDTGSDYYISALCVLDQKDSTYEVTPIYEKDTHEGGKFIIAKNLIGDSKKEIVTLHGWVDSGGMEFEWDWKIWQLKDGTYTKIGRINASKNLLDITETTRSEYVAKINFANLDSDLELEIQVLGTIRDVEIRSDKTFPKERTQEIYDWNGTEYICISRMETPITSEQE